MIHVIFSPSAAGSLRRALRIVDRRLKVVDLSDELDWGPISPSDFEDREAWLNEKLPWSEGGWDWIGKGGQLFFDKLDNSDEHCVWVAPQNARELCGLHWYLDRFGGDRANFVIVDQGFPGSWNGEPPTGLGELSPTLFEYLIAKADRVCWDEPRFPRERWAQLGDEATNLRIILDGQAVSVADDYFDAALLSECGSNWQKIYRVIGNAMGAQWDCGHFPSDLFLLWRLRELASHGAIEANQEIRYGPRPNDPLMIRLT